MTVILFLLANSWNPVETILLWVLTGFGGGTVFYIGKINKRDAICSKETLTFSENIEHILGTVLGMAVYILTDRITSPIIFSGICAIMALLGMIGYQAGIMGQKKSTQNEEYQ
ncbi:MAG: hypothetical protein WCS13_07495 [Candidatus Cloacimonadaceae bacterium]